MNKILILGGTGAMGISLTEILAKRGDAVTVTSRREHQSGDVQYIKGNAKDDAFLQEVLKTRYDVVVDFMSYTTAQFRERAKTLLNATGQYIFLSSARVYAPSDKVLTEESPRLLETCQDKAYLATDEYALAKARQEDILHQCSGCYTIVRPSLTYNRNRLQLVISEKEEWLSRALAGKKIVLPSDIMSVKTSMAYGGDVAVAIAHLIGNEKTYGETFHVATAEARTWSEILEIYQKTLEKKCGHRAKVTYVPKAEDIGNKLGRTAQIRYARGVDRVFDNSKLQRLAGPVSFLSPEEGLTRCLEEFLENPKFGNCSLRVQAYFDRITHEKSKQAGLKKKGKYFILRYLKG